MNYSVDDIDKPLELVVQVRLYVVVAVLHGHCNYYVESIVISVL